MIMNLGCSPLHEFVWIGLQPIMDRLDLFYFYFLYQVMFACLGVGQPDQHFQCVFVLFL